MWQGDVWECGMRKSDGFPESCDELLDRPRSILPFPKSPRLTVVISGPPENQAPDTLSLFQSAQGKANLAVLAREDDADRRIKEETAAYLLKRLEDRALRMGKDLAMARAVTLIDRLRRCSMDEIAATSSDWLGQMGALFQTLGKPRPFAERTLYDQCLIEVWFDHDAKDRAERARLQANLADAYV